MTIKVIVFDFDGTIADTREAFVKILNNLSGEFGYQPVSEQEALELKNLSSREIIKQSQISVVKIPLILRRAKVELGKEITNLKPVEEMAKTVEEISQKGYQLGIITSNIKENVVTFLEKNNLKTAFNFIYSGTSFFGKDKVINKLFKEYQLGAENIVYVGDETRDIEAAKKSGVKVIAVSWGFNSEAVLAEYEPDYLVNEPKALVEVVNNFEKG
ncbi:MAG: HAD-IA family hydrolase [Oscillatoria sp. PMC 1051.18]|nr:HAD-IA family hydrolase [Oscillatoria sp. PMC 1050.18]MEC5032857.1 HAD-IA family hydrolase [Oscillatoria sp. PMC 1051.18]